MKEQDLISLGFKRTGVSKEDEYKQFCDRMGWTLAE